MCFLSQGDSLFKKEKVQRVLLVGAFLIVVVLGWLLYRTVRFRDSITFFNVGEGDSILMVSRDGRAMLVDGGPSEEVLGRLGEVLSPSSRQIDIVVATHLHADHITGLLSVLAQYKVSYLLLPVQRYDSPVAHGLLDMANKKGVKTLYVRRGYKITLDDIKVSVVWPDKAHSHADNINDSALMLLVESGDTRVLLTSDVEMKCNAPMVLDSDIKAIGAVDVLKVPHQGSNRALCDDTLSILKPKIAIIPVGKNSYGHPSHKTLRLLDMFGVYIVRTDRDGNSTVHLGGDTTNKTVSFW